MNLAALGWDSFFEGHFRAFRDRGLSPSRVVCEHKHAYLVRNSLGESQAGISGKMRYAGSSRSDLPSVGDWVAIDASGGGNTAVIQAVLPRKSKFSRNVAGGRTEEQVVVANIDSVFLVSGLDGGRSFNLRRIERYLTLAWSSGAAPVVILNKADVCTDVPAHIEAVKSMASAVPVHAVSALERLGLDALQAYLGEGQTVVFLGSSGAGKSTLINSLLGAERLRVGEVREDDHRGRHVTTCRELVLLPDGGMVIDTPGMRELQMWGDEEALDSAFDDIEELAGRCRFRDCRHESEPGCSVRQALEEDALDAGRWQSYLKLKKELRHLAARQERSPQALEREKWKKIKQWSRKAIKKR